MMNNNLFALSRKLGQLCVQRNVRIAFAESCTGGLLSALITDVSGSSAWFNGSAVVYSNAAKSHLIHVDEQLILDSGAVSEAVAQVMATGARHQFQADVTLAITGIAGPYGGTPQKPVGMVCFGLSDEKGVDTKTMHFTGGRSHIRHQACLFALEWMVMHLSIQ